MSPLWPFVWPNPISSLQSAPTTFFSFPPDISHYYHFVAMPAFHHVTRQLPVIVQASVHDWELRAACPASSRLKPSAMPFVSRSRQATPSSDSVCMSEQTGMAVSLVNKLTASALFCRRFLVCPRSEMDERVALTTSGADGKERAREFGEKGGRPPPSPLVRYSGVLGSS